MGDFLQEPQLELQPVRSNFLNNIKFIVQRQFIILTLKKIFSLFEHDNYLQLLVNSFELQLGPIPRATIKALEKIWNSRVIQ